MPNLRGSEWLIIILLLVLLFGAKRLPDAARSMGRSLRVFKAETKGLTEDAPSPPPAAPVAGAAAPVTPAVVPPGASAAPVGPDADPRAGGARSPQPPTQA